MCLKLLEENVSEAQLDLDALSGPTEIDLEVEGSGLKYITKLGVSLSPSVNNVLVPAQTVSMNPRYIVFNESENCDCSSVLLGGFLLFHLFVFLEVPFQITPSMSN